MNFKKIIALFCFIFLCLHALPVKRFGAVLFNNQITEDIVQADDSGEKQVSENFSDYYLPTSYNCYTFELTSVNNHTTNSHSPLVLLHIAEVQTPPPDVIS